jgi:hypothetical protein
MTHLTINTFVMGLVIVLCVNINSSAEASVLSNLQTLHKIAPNIPESVLESSLKAYYYGLAHSIQKKPTLLTIIDYSEPSSEKRMWVLDIKNNKLLYHTYVTHGVKSGEKYAVRFSNAANSHETSIGVYKTAGTYYGANGFSLRLIGLEKGFNDNAMKRAIVIHGANYASPEVVKRYHRLGRSWGCPTVGTAIAKPLIDTIKNGSLVVAYYPSNQWLQNSRFLNA